MLPKDRRGPRDLQGEADLAKAFVHTLLMLEAAGHGPSPSRLPQTAARHLSGAEKELRRALEWVVRRLVAARRSQEEWVPCELGRHESASHEAGLQAFTDTLASSLSRDWGSIVDTAADWLSPSTSLTGDWKQKLLRALQKEPLEGLELASPGARGDVAPALGSATTAEKGGEEEGPETRRALAKMVMKLFEHWGLSNADQAVLLGLSPDSRSSLNRYRRGNPLADNRDLLDRVGHILAIHRALRMIFPENRELAYCWPTSPNRDFQGKTPVDVIREEGFAGLLQVRDYLEDALTH